jgi:hypothetical protein
VIGESIALFLSDLFEDFRCADIVIIIFELFDIFTEAFDADDLFR